MESNQDNYSNPLLWLSVGCCLVFLCQRRRQNRKTNERRTLYRRKRKINDELQYREMMYQAFKKRFLQEQELARQEQLIMLKGEKE